jgi:uncharacterized protein with PIN domain
VIQVRFLCDEMLVRLGRWLRAAGHDTLIAGPGAADTALLALAEEEGRILLTRDRALIRMAEARTPAMLLSDRMPDQALRLRDALGLDWLAAPFTRCLIDNCLLEEATPGGAIPEAARSLPGPFRRCPCCGRDYWPGSHVKRMLARLAAWNAPTPAQLFGHALR